MSDERRAGGFGDSVETNALLALIEDELVDTGKLLVLAQRLSSERFQEVCDRLIEIADDDLEIVSDFILSLASRDRH